MKLLTTDKINLPDLFKSTQTINAKLYLKRKGKQYFGIKAVPLNTLVRYIPACQYIIHRILEGQRLTNTNWYVNLPSKSIDKVLGGTKRFIAIHLLHELGIIEINHKYNSSGYLKKKFSKSYLIDSKYTGVIHTLEVDIKEGDIHKPVIHSKGVIHSDHLHSKNNWLSGIRFPVVSHPIHLQYQIKNLKNLGEYRFSVGQKTNRVFTSVNQMKKEDRTKLVDNTGNRLIEVDFRSSHLIRVIKHDLINALYNSQFSLEFFTTELNAFKEDVVDKDFYNKFSIMYKKRFNKTITRDRAKIMVMYWLNNSYTNWKSNKLLNDLYPQISHYIESVNGTTRNTLSIKLQLSESYLLNDLIIGRLAKENPDSICYTVFDGYLIEEQYLNQLMTIVKEEGLRYLGFEPVICVKGNCDENLNNLKNNSIEVDNNHIDLTYKTEEANEPVFISL